MNYLFGALLTVVTTAGFTLADSSDWPQWRGLGRNGIAQGGELADTWPDGGPPLLWDTAENIPSNDDGGHGSPVIANGRAYMSIVWHRDVPPPLNRNFTCKSVLCNKSHHATR